LSYEKLLLLLLFEYEIDLLLFIEGFHNFICSNSNNINKKIFYFVYVLELNWQPNLYHNFVSYYFPFKIKFQNNNYYYYKLLLLN
jgi:hypothetical protein